MGASGRPHREIRGRRRAAWLLPLAVLVALLVIGVPAAAAADPVDPGISVTRCRSRNGDRDGRRLLGGRLADPVLRLSPERGRLLGILRSEHEEAGHERLAVQRAVHDEGGDRHG